MSALLIILGLDTMMANVETTITSILGLKIIMIHENLS